jgi:hypothetical protein
MYNVYTDIKVYTHTLVMYTQTSRRIHEYIQRTHQIQRVDLMYTQAHDMIMFIYTPH